MHNETSTLIDILGSHHVLEIQDDHLVIDQYPVSAIRQAETVIFVTTDRQEIVCTPEACWYAVAGSTVAPTAAEAGQLLVSNLSYWNDTLRLHALTQSLFRLVGEQAPVLILPQTRIDPFIEAALARLPQEPTLTRVTALAQVIDQPLALVIGWLQQRGKTVQVPEQQSSADTSEEGAALNTEALPVLGVTSPAPSAKRSMFRWTAEMVQELTTEFLASPLDQSISATARTIAVKHDWPADKLEYKIYQLDLPELRQEQHRAGKAGDKDTHDQDVQHHNQTQDGIDVAVVVPEFEQKQDVPKEPEMQESNGAVELRKGNYVWDGRVNNEMTRWFLDYPYGAFPVQKDAQVIYHGHTYMILKVGTSSFAASAVGVPLESQEEEVSHV